MVRLHTRCKVRCTLRCSVPFLPPCALASMVQLPAFCTVKVHDGVCMKHANGMSSWPHAAASQHLFFCLCDKQAKHKLVFFSRRCWALHGISSGMHRMNGPMTS